MHVPERCNRRRLPPRPAPLQVIDELLVLDTRSMEWQQPRLPAGQRLPSARNAASLVPAVPGGATLVLHGGWKAFVESYDDTFVVEVRGAAGSS
jgi:hypothetical protein